MYDVSHFTYIGSLNFIEIEILKTCNFSVYHAYTHQDKISYTNSFDSFLKKKKKLDRKKSIARL